MRKAGVERGFGIWARIAASRVNWVRESAMFIVFSIGCRQRGVLSEESYREIPEKRGKRLAK